MMALKLVFLLTNTVTGEVIYLPHNGECTIGRKNCDILLLDDQSISRQHAKLKIADGKVKLLDCNSRYHTFHKAEAIPPNVEIVLNHKDLVKFGAFKNTFIFESCNLIVCGSMLSPDQKQSLKQILAKCNGKYVDKWSKHCSHLALEELQFTVKALQALVDEKPFVTLNFFTDLAKSMAAKEILPDVNKYKPKIKEELLKSNYEYCFDERRRSLFKDKVFVFSKTKAKSELEELIQSCGGSCISWEEEPKTMFEINSSSSDYIFTTPALNDEPNESYDIIIKALSKENKRAVPLTELVLAIVHCSCQKYCNPKFDKAVEVFAAPKGKTQTQRVLAAETQTQNELPGPSGIKTEVIIAPSLDTDWPAERQENYGKVTGIKRVAAEGKIDPQSKRQKVDKPVTREGSKLKQSSLAAFVGKQKKNDNAAGRTSKESTCPSIKRKTPDSSDASSCLKINPFVMVKPAANKRMKTKDDKNPFEMVKAVRPQQQEADNSSKVEQRQNNPFSSIINVSSQSQVKIEPEIENNSSLLSKNVKSLLKSKTDSFGTSVSAKNSTLKASWISKTSNIKSQAIVKEEDPTLAEIFKAFKDCVIVAKLPVYDRSSTLRDISNASTANQNSTTMGVKNFKKFKKVKPLHPQVTIVNPRHFKRYGPGDGFAQEDQLDTFSSSDCGEGTSRQSQEKGSNKKRIIL